MYRSGTLATAFMVATTRVVHTPNAIYRVMLVRVDPRANCSQGIAAKRGIIRRKFKGAHQVWRSHGQ